MSGIEMLNEDEGQAAVGRHVPKEAPEGIEAAGGGADADDDRARRRAAPFTRSIAIAAALRR